MVSEVFNIDCMDYLKGVEDNFFELAIVDPPYGKNCHKEQGLNDKRTGSRKKSKWIGGDWDKSPPSPEYFKKLFRVSKNQIIWGGNYFDLPPSECFVIWDKVQRINQADCEYAWTSFKKPARIFTYARGNLQGFRNPFRFHSTQKPVALYKWLLKNYAKPGDKILDTHLGSGSSRIAAYDMGFDFWGMEKDKEIFAAEEERFSIHINQGELFEVGDIQKSIYQGDT